MWPDFHFDPLFPQIQDFLEEKPLSTISEIRGPQTSFFSLFADPFSVLFPIAGSRVKKDYVYNIPWINLRPRRGGIVPYRLINGIRYFGFGIDRWFNQGTDFGGMLDYDIDENALKGALREFSEESLGIFGRIPDHLLNRGLAVYDHEMIIIFIDITELIEGVSTDELDILFQQKSARKQQRKHQEIKSITWIPEDYLRWMIDFLPSSRQISEIRPENQRIRQDQRSQRSQRSQQDLFCSTPDDLEIYRVVRNFLYRGGNFYDLLL